MPSIVVPVNYTANAANAARYAADLAISIGADIHLVYVFEVPVSLSEVPVPPSAFDTLQQGSVTLLKDLKRELLIRTEGSLRITTAIETGPVEPQLEAFCKAKEPLLVVMGASDHNIANVFEGSNTVRAVRHLPYPVLVVPENASFHRIRKIMVACDAEDILTGMEQALPFLKILSEHLVGARLEILHVVTDNEENTAPLVEAFNAWKGEIAGLAPQLHFTRRPDVEEGISHHLKKFPADLLMVFPKKHWVLEFHRSQAKRLVLHPPVPVMSVHE